MVDLRNVSGDLPKLFETVVAAEPDLPALVQGEQRLTFAQWWLESSSSARKLAEMGVGRGDVVVLLLPSGAEFAACYLAVMRLGAIVSAINPRLGSDEIQHIVRRCQPRLIVSDTPERVRTFVSCPIQPPPLINKEAASHAWPDDWVRVDDDTPAVVVWTSGSTGTPKGAWFDHRTLAFIANHIGPLSEPHDRKLFPIPFAHTAFMTRIYDQLLYRSTLVLTPTVWSADKMLDTLAVERITVGQGVPTQWEKLIALDRLEETDLSHLRLVSTGASHVPPSLVRALRDRLGCPVVVRYASTEVPLACGTRIGDPLETITNTVGGPLGGAEIEIRDGDAIVAPVGVTGRVFLRSPAQMRGYWQEPELTDATIGPDGWLATSDLGRLDAAGNLTIVGRADDAYIRGGYNVYPAEVETALMSHPDVARVAVVGTAAPIIGEIGVAFVVPAAGRTATVTEADLRAWCAHRIADYKVPDHVAFVNDLPVNATYKVDTPRLRALAATLAAGTTRSSPVGKPSR